MHSSFVNRLASKELACFSQGVLCNNFGWISVALILSIPVSNLWPILKSDKFQTYDLFTKVFSLV